MSAEQSGSIKYYEVDISKMQAGTCVDRPLYVYLKKNDHYVCLLRSFHLLEERVLKKLLTAGKVFSPVDTIENVFPDFIFCIDQIKKIFALDQANFLSHHELLEKLHWIVEHFASSSSSEATQRLLFVLMQRLLEHPSDKSLAHVLDVSVDIYERAIHVSSTACFIALILGYLKPSFLKQVAEASFNSELGLSEILLSENPGLENLDYRFCYAISARGLGLQENDEVIDILEAASLIVSKNLKLKDFLETKSLLSLQIHQIISGGLRNIDNPGEAKAA